MTTVFTSAVYTPNGRSIASLARGTTRTVSEMAVPDGSDPTKRENTKYCEFHMDHGHRTNDRIQLKKEIEYLIRRGYLRRFIASEGQDQAQPPPLPR